MRWHVVFSALLPCPALWACVDYLLPRLGIFPKVGNKTDGLTDHRHEFFLAVLDRPVYTHHSHPALHHSALCEESRSPTDVSHVSVDNPYMVYLVRFLTLHRVFLTSGGGLTGVSRRQYWIPPFSVFIRYTPVLPIYRSAAADLLRTITVAFSGTILAEFSASTRPPPPKLGKSSADCATCKINFYQGHSTADFT